MKCETCPCRHALLPPALDAVVLYVFSLPPGQLAWLPARPQTTRNCALSVACSHDVVQSQQDQRRCPARVAGPAASHRFVTSALLLAIWKVGAPVAHVFHSYLAARFQVAKLDQYWCCKVEVVALDVGYRYLRDCHQVRGYPAKKQLVKTRQNQLPLWQRVEVVSCSQKTWKRPCKSVTCKGWNSDVQRAPSHGPRSQIWVERMPHWEQSYFAQAI
jgi:hypothetical protein